MDRRGTWFVSLFLLDMWERFSFYGMLAILFLFAVATPGDGGLGMPAGSAGALVGTYVAGSFLAAMPGSWLGDRILGSRRATLYGGLLIAAGHTSLALPNQPTCYLGLALVAAGTGLLKPNLTTMLGAFYPRGAETARESGFAIFYMSIQISGLLAPIVTGYLGEHINWHLGFGAAAVGMTLGIACYLWGVRRFGDVGVHPVAPVDPVTRRRIRRGVLVGSAVLVAVLGADQLAGTLRAAHVIALIGLAALVTPAVLFRSVLRSRLVSPAERRGVRAYLWVFLSAALFWMLYSQATSVLSLFAKESTERYAIPASWFQSLHPLFVLAGAPIAAWLWPRLPGRPDPAVKFGIGLLLAGVSYLVMAGGAVAAGSGRASAWWLVLAYLAQSAGELALAPVGLSVTVLVAPRAYASQMMGIWWLAAALGAGIGGQLARLYTVLPHPIYFLVFAVPPLLVAALLVAGRERLSRSLVPAGTAAIPVPVEVPA